MDVAPGPSSWTSPATRVSAATDPRARRQIHLASLRAARRACRRPHDDPQLRARRRLRLDARVSGGAGRLDRASAPRHSPTNRRWSSIDGPRPARPAAPPPRRSTAATPAARCACWPASSPRIRSSSTLDRRSLALAAPDAPHHRPALAHGRAHRSRRRRPSAAHHSRRRSRPASISFPRCRARRSRAPSCWQACKRDGRTRGHRARRLPEIIRSARWRRSAPRSNATGTRIAVDGGQRLRGLDARVPGDISSAAFPAAAAAALPGSDVTHRRRRA